MDEDTIAVAVDYINEIRHHMDTGDYTTAAVIVDLLEDIINPGAIEWQVNEDWTPIDSHCDYCNCEVDNINPLPGSMFWACDTCYSQYVAG